ncbi:hypothetical protein HDE_08301 [Halotydeus destructor]|nr:hypothetical protein HDE_08301 [Halotydeus destructor]
MEIARYIQAPQLHLCPATYQVFDFELYNAKFNTTLGNIAGSEDIYAFQTMITVSQLLEYSYPAQDLVVFCAIRRPHSNAVKYLGREECTDIFSLTKYFIYEYICYKVDLKPGKGGVLYDTHRLGCAVNHPGLFFELRINPKWLTSMRTFKILSAQKKEGEKRIGGAQMIEIGWLNGSGAVQSVHCITLQDQLQETSAALQDNVSRLSETRIPKLAGVLKHLHESANSEKTESSLVCFAPIRPCREAPPISDGLQEHDHH